MIEQFKCCVWHRLISESLIQRRNLLGFWLQVPGVTQNTDMRMGVRERGHPGRGRVVHVYFVSTGKEKKEKHRNR